MNLTELCRAFVEADDAMMRDWDAWCAEGARRLREVGGKAVTEPDAKGYRLVYSVVEESFASTVYHEEYDGPAAHAEVGEWIRDEEKKLRATAGEAQRIREELGRLLAIDPTLVPAFARAWLREVAK